MPLIELATLPGLENAQAIFGTAITNPIGYSDVVVDIMVYVYDTDPQIA